MSDLGETLCILYYLNIKLANAVLAGFDERIKYMPTLFGEKTYLTSSSRTPINCNKFGGKSYT